MLYFSKWKTISIIAVIVFGFTLAFPNAVPPGPSENPEASAQGFDRDDLPGFLRKTINLGLDLQGGAHMLLSVDIDSVKEAELNNQRDSAVQALREAGRIRSEFIRVEGEAVVGRFRNAEDVEAGMAALKELEEPINPTVLGSPKTTRVEQTGDRTFELTITNDYIESIRDRTISQSIEVLRKRIDPSGTTEMTLVKEGSERILLQIPGAKNVSEIKDRINQTANLTFHMVRPESGSDAAMRAAIESNGERVPPGAVYYPQQDGGGLIVQKRTNINGGCLKSASEGLHPTERHPIVNFTFNFKCARLFGKLTSENIGKRFAVVLDGEIITAPTIQSAITGGGGFIEGSFTPESSRELSLLLNAGALPAKLEIVEERTVGAELGQDAIDAGKIASVIGLLGVAVFMWLSYGMRFGSIANFALFTNIALIAAALSFLGATLTLPGIAGIILTIGMAVDANVLIFERIREETHLGRPPVNAIDTGYRRSLAPILDANITTLIAAITLYFVGSGPIRGFAVTLAIGIVMSVFTAVVVARLITATWLRGTRPKTLPI